MCPSGHTLLLSGRFLFGDGGHCGMTKNLPLRKMHFMAQRVRAAGQAMQRKEDCSRPLSQGLWGAFRMMFRTSSDRRLRRQSRARQASMIFAQKSSCRSGCRPEKRPERGQPIYDRPAWGGMTVPIPAGRHRRLYVAKKEIGGPFRERLSLFGAVCSSPFLTK